MRQILLLNRRKNLAQEAFNALSKFIPIEVLAPYMLVMNALKSEQATRDAEQKIVAISGTPLGSQPAEAIQPFNWYPLCVILFFLIIAPLLLILFEYATGAASDLEWPDARQISWRATTSAIAFAAWSVYVPNQPFEQFARLAVAGTIALLLSLLLTAADKIVIRLFKPKS